MIMHLASKSTDCTVLHRAISRPYRLRKNSSKQSKRRDLHLSDYIVRQTIIHFIIASTTMNNNNLFLDRNSPYWLPKFLYLLFERIW